jgi:hypothetical protein
LKSQLKEYAGKEEGPWDYHLPLSVWGCRGTKCCSKVKMLGAPMINGMAMGRLIILSTLYHLMSEHNMKYSLWENDREDIDIF